MRFDMVILVCVFQVKRFVGAIVEPPNSA